MCKSTCRCGVLLALVAFSGTVASGASPFATELVSATGPFGPDPADDPATVLGKPTTEVYDPGMPPFVPEATFTPSLAYPAWGTDEQGNKLVTTLLEDAEIVVAFDHKVIDHPANWYGLDFTVFGNAFFTGSSVVQPDTDMTQYMLTGQIAAEAVTVSVSSDGETWYTYASGPFADGLFPTNPFAWDRETGDWGEELDWTKPVDPSLTPAAFANLSAADAIDLYAGSAGGTSFDLAEATGLLTTPVLLADGQVVERKYIRYIKVHGTAGGDIDGFSDVAPKVPTPGDLNDDGDRDATDIDLLYAAVAAGLTPPSGDINGDGIVDQADVDLLVRDLLGTEYGDITLDGRVNAADLSVLAGNWLTPTGAGWATGDMSGDGAVNAADLSLLASHWLYEAPAAGETQPVPAPATAWLLLAATAALLRRHRPGRLAETS